VKVLMVVQRYGRDVAGGAEQLCRMYAQGLVEREHDVDVLTTRAASYVDWANFYPAGTEELDGVKVHRLDVARPRNHEVFGRLQERVVAGRKPVPYFLQREWMRQQGPDVPELASWLERGAAAYDVVVFFTYLYNTTWTGLPVAARRAPTVLHPTAHDEAPIHLPLFDALFRHAHAFGFLTVEEVEFVEQRFRLRRPYRVLGVGVDLDPPGDAGSFRSRFGIGDRPYLVYVGRLDPHKGTEELYDQFLAYKQRQPGPLALVYLGEPVKPMAPHPDVFVTGFVDDTTRWSALRGCRSLVMPSWFESFSMALTEAWAVGRPALVQQRSSVLAGQARRSGGAIPYRGFAQFEAALDLLEEDPGLGDRLGAAGRRYVEAHYAWPDVLSRYERLLATTARR
jgi:glycosyltransferase involved in cell wall biosynthesis